MKKLFDFVLIICCGALFVVSCSSAPSENAVQTAIAQTQAGPSSDETGLVPTQTPKPLVSCPDDEVVIYLEDLEFMLEAFDDTTEIAGSTARMGLAPVIQDMQSQKRDARRMDRPECANYLQDLVIVAMETKIDAFISFLSQDSDSVVSRKFTASEEVRSLVNDEIGAFRDDPLSAYKASELTAEALIESADQAVPFQLPDGWVDIQFPSSEELILSIPDNWSRTATGDEGQFLQLKNDDGTMTVLMDIFDERIYTEFESDRARLFSLQTTLETQDWEFYLERSAEVELFALNRAYIVEYSTRVSSSSDIEDRVWTIVITPEEKEVFIIALTDRDEFAQIDKLILEEIYGSIRVRQ